ncbi:MAG: VCBS repeat-containing protein [Proteobacteria bacterium]|nr:VCBS repeat-containing protein [Pseudomonadota bacterium]
MCHTPATVGESCENAVCTEGKCINSICTIEMDIDEDCTPTKGHACKPGLACDEDLLVCYKPLELGADCSGADTYCEAGLICHAEKGICMNNGAIGDTCDEDAYLSCNHEAGLVCIDGKCRKPVAKDCDELHPCANDKEVCYDGKCIESHGCEGDHECLADTYCCTEDECKVKGVCLPYGEGPRTEVNEGCQYETVQGLFEADVQCEWTGPEEGDPYPGHVNVLTTPIVINTPHDSGTANEIVFGTYNCRDGGSDSSSGTNFNCNSVIRILNGETCKLHENIFDDLNHVIGSSNLAAADVDNDTFVEIFAGRGSAQDTSHGATGGYGIVAFHWDDTEKKYVTWWHTTNHATSMGAGGPAVHDINNDGIPEVISNNGEVFDSLTGIRLNPNQEIGELNYTTVADLDGDGIVEAIGNNVTYAWDDASSRWVARPYANRSTPWHHAYADFGTPKDDGTFDFTQFDGIAEIVGCSGGVNIHTLEGKLIFNMPVSDGGGPCTVGDFDGDQRPEVATAFGHYYRIYDPLCKAGVDGCIADYTLWQNTSQDFSSASTGSSLFDFDGDGIMEAVYADECFTRVYDGPTGNVLFSSHHTSCTWYEYPIIADVDNDESAEIIVGSNNNCSVTCTNAVQTTGPDGRTYAIDPIHHGLGCRKDDDCYSGVCKNELCRCTDYQQCNAKAGVYENGCVDALTAAEQADGKVCRAIHPQTQFMTGVRVLRDRLDRWTSSRNLWNQHIYTITNINDDQTIPQTSKWVQNFKQSGLNNFRQNVQGVRGKNAAPDITCKLNKDNLCVHSSESNEITLTGVVCNRGTKMVASKMPASFYDVTDGNLGTKYCTAYTAANVPIGGCDSVSCTLNDTDIVGKRIRMIANDDGQGGKTTVECNDKNNTDEILLESCGLN